MERGAPHLANMIRNGIDTRLKRLAPHATPRPIYVGDTELIGLVITRIQTHGPAHSGYTDDHTTHLGSLRRTWGKKLFTLYIEAGTGISQTLAQGVPVYDRAGTQNIGGRQFDVMYRDLTEAVKSEIDKL